MSACARLPFEAIENSVSLRHDSPKKTKEYARMCCRALSGSVGNEDFVRAMFASGLVRVVVFTLDCHGTSKPQPYALQEEKSSDPGSWHLGTLC